MQRDQLINARREAVNLSYNSAKATNYVNYLEGDDRATEEYIYPNQREDANNIVDIFYRNKRRIITVQKKTKVGADGLMIEIAKLMTTHNDDSFVINTVRIITGMSNAGWEKDMKDKAPSCFKENIFHHGKLKKSDLLNIRDALIIIDEIDTGDKELQVLHRTLKESGILNTKYMVDKNIRVIVISATLIRELYDLYRWGDLHELYKMTIPHSYVSSKDFVEMEIIKEWYPLNSRENARKWIEEDILENYGNDFRVHIVRLTTKTVEYVHDECISQGVTFMNHTSVERLSDEDIDEIFRKPLTNHIVLGVKGLLRRANLIPNTWKLRIGATMELYTLKTDNNVQIQGLPGRMTGYWRHILDGGHKTGPYRTSIKAIEEYEIIYNDPFGNNSYQAAGFNKNKKGKVKSAATMLSPRNITNLTPVDLPVYLEEPEEQPKPVIKRKTLQEIKDCFKNELVGYGSGPHDREIDDDGFYRCITQFDKMNKKIRTTAEMGKYEASKKWGFRGNTQESREKNMYRVYPVYSSESDKDSLEWWLIYY